MRTRAGFISATVWYNSDVFLAGFKPRRMSLRVAAGLTPAGGKGVAKRCFCDIKMTCVRSARRSPQFEAYIYE